MLLPAVVAVDAARVAYSASLLLLSLSPSS